jgi:(1->4)-alpha-D-glucan 1-alpha-D-glucosylmutase
VLADAALVAEVEAFVGRLLPAWRATSLAQKAVQLTMPGVADVYQGSELWDLSLVDPDNRRPVDWDARRAALAALEGSPPALDDLGTAKLALVARVLRLRREEPDTFLSGAYEGLDAGPRAIGFVRGDRVVTVAPTRALTVQRTGWGDDEVTLPAGDWVDVVTGARRSGTVPLEALLDDFPVAVLRRA